MFSCYKYKVEVAKQAAVLRKSGIEAVRYAYLFVPGPPEWLSPNQGQR